MQPADPHAQLAEIRAIMERSTRFISLSGLSGVGVGLVALVGAGAAHFYLASHFKARFYLWVLRESGLAREKALPYLLALALAMMATAVLVAAFFTLRHTRRAGLRTLWTAPARRLLLALLLPLAAGGAFCVKLYLLGAVELVAPGLLVFYGLALLNGSKYTLDEVRYLGLTLVGLGLLALVWPGYGLAWFALGFGLGHISYGLLMYWRHERGATAG